MTADAPPPSSPPAPPGVPAPPRPGYRLAREVFLRGLGAILVVAFLSLYVQIGALAGDDGILPVRELMAGMRKFHGPGAWTKVPTLCWWGESTAFLEGLCLGGAAVSALPVLGLVPAPAFALAWLLYLSLVVAGQDFLAFQWDILLLECCFLAVFLAPWRLRSGIHRGPAPSAAALWALRILFFQLMFQSGCTKLLSDDPVWWDLTALDYHYWTQPLPTPLAWYAALLPGWFQRLSCGLMFAIEIVLPFAIFLPGRARLVAFAGTALLMGGIALTGNYTFFNLLTVLLAVPLLDDASLGRILPAARGEAEPEGRPKRAAAGLACALLASVSGLHLTAMFAGYGNLPGPATSFLRTLTPFRTFSSYGLFRVMTRTRPEIQLEGSADGRTWRPYLFRWKPGPLDRAPPVVVPHQPRLDWQMWFAALGNARRNPWFLALATRLLEGSAPVRALFAEDPFPDAPPRYLRARLFHYRFTSWGEGRRTGAWWTREEKGLYLPVIALRPGEIR